MRGPSAALILASATVWGAHLAAADCNQNGVEDAEETARPPFSLVAFGTVELGRARCPLAGDLDGDGDADLVVQGAAHGHLAFFLNEGSGSFVRGGGHSLGAFGEGFVLGDIDGDGDLDLAVSLADSVRLLRNDGAGRFRADAEADPPVGLVHLDIGDLDGDGDADLVGLARRGTDLIALFNRGDGMFDVSRRAPLGGVPAGVELAAIDGDAAADVVLRWSRSTTLVLLNDGDGGFSVDRAVSAPGTLAAAGDLDGDGDGDLITVSGSESHVLLNGPRGFEESQSLPELAHPRLIDLDGDGGLDFFGVVLAPGARELVVLENDGAGRFAGPRLARRMDRSAPVCFADADFDADGSADLAMVDGTGTIELLRNAPYSESDCDRDGVPDDCDPATPDCDGDGVSDLCEVLDGAEADCNRNRVPDRCEIASGAGADCNGNGVLDECDIASGRSLDLVPNGIPDECEIDCDQNGVIDSADIASGAPDCDANGVPDACDVLPGLAFEPVVVPAFADPGGRRVLGTAVADLDGDGDLDLAVPYGFSVELIENRGGRRFGHLSSLTVGSAPVDVLVADLDGDGRLDLATANSQPGFPGNVSVFLGDGSGGFGPARNVAVGHDPAGIISLDLDGDGDLDLAVANSDSLDVSLLFNDATGAFRRHERISLLQGWGPRSLAAADLEGDGDPDLVVATAGGGVVLRNDGAGGFQVEWLWTPSVAIGRVLPADLDGDGDIDAALAGAEGIDLLLNARGELVWTGRVGPPRATGLAAADVDGDGVSDLVVASPSMTSGPIGSLLGYLIGHGGGSFTAPRSVAAGAPGPFGGLEAADLDGDGRADLITRPDSGEVRLFFAGRGVIARDCNANGVPDACDVAGDRSLDCDHNGVPDECDVRERDCNANGVPDPCDLSTVLAFRPDDQRPLDARYTRVADLDGDGREDLVSANTGRNGVDVFLAGPAGLGPPVRYLDGDKARALVITDIDGDGAPDVAAGTLDDELVLLRNTGGGAFVEVRRQRTRRWPTALAAGDFDGDGFTDFAVGAQTALDGANSGSSPHVLELWLGAGGGALAPGGRFPIACCPAEAIAGDLDGDGDLDIVVASQGASCTGCIGTRFTVLLNDGAGGMDHFVLDATGEPITSDVVNFELVDMNGDGNLDLVTGRGAFVSPGDGRFGPRVAHPAVGRFMATADLDGDGDRDLLLDEFDAMERTHTLLAFPNRGDGSFGEGEALYTRRTNFAISAGDIDGDGDPDVALISFLDTTLRLFINESTRAVSRDLDGDGVPDECGAAVFHRGDPNADGRANVADAVFLLRFLFVDEGVELPCAEAADADNDGRIVITDPIALLEWLFRGGPPPAAPGPPPAPCGANPDESGSAGDLGCERYTRCE